MWRLQFHRAGLKRAMPKGVAFFIVHNRLMKNSQGTHIAFLSRARVGSQLSQAESGAEEFCWPALRSLQIPFSLRYNYSHEKSCAACNTPSRHPSIRRHRIVWRRGRPVGFGAGGAKEDVAAITRNPHYRNYQAGPLAALLFFVGGGGDGRPGRRCLALISPARLGTVTDSMWIFSQGDLTINGINPPYFRLRSYFPND